MVDQTATHNPAEYRRRGRYRLSPYRANDRSRRLRLLAPLLETAMADSQRDKSLRCNHQTAADAARHKREDLLSRGWPTSAEVGGRLGATSPAEFATTLRMSGHLLGAWSAKDHTFVYPACQFDTDGRPLQVIHELLATLPASGDEGGWRRTFWLYGPRECLNGMTPAELMGAEPARVLALARNEFDTSQARTA